MTAPLNGLKRKLPETYALLIEQGWKLSVTQNGHIRCTSPQGGIVIGANFGHTNNDTRAVLNFENDLKKHGLVFPKNDHSRPRPVRLRDGNNDTLWSTGKTQQFLDARTGRVDELAEWVRLGYIKPPVVKGSTRGYRAVDIIDFKNSALYSRVHVPRRSYTKRATAKPEVAARDPKLDVPADVAPPNNVTTSSKHLAELLTTMLRPMIEEAVRKEVTNAARTLATVFHSWALTLDQHE
jgi:hypothetical protein